MKLQSVVGRAAVIRRLMGIGGFASKMAGKLVLVAGTGLSLGLVEYLHVMVAGFFQSTWSKNVQERNNNVFYDLTLEVTHCHSAISYWLDRSTLFSMGGVYEKHEYQKIVIPGGTLKAGSHKDRDAVRRHEVNWIYIIKPTGPGSTKIGQICDVRRKKHEEQVSVMEGDLLIWDLPHQLGSPEIEWTLELLDLHPVLTPLYGLWKDWRTF